MANDKPAYRLFPDYAKEGGFQLEPERAEQFDLRLVSVDPGGEHVGVAVFGKSTRRGGWVCVWAGEMTPVEFEDWLAEHSIHSGLDILVVEEWRLFADKAAAQTGSAMETSQLIGAIRFIHRSTKDIAVRWPRPEVELHFQSPAIKTPTRSMLRNRKIESVAKRLRAGGHALDAELHGYHHIVHTRGESAEPTPA